MVSLAMLPRPLINFDAWSAALSSVQCWGYALSLQQQQTHSWPYSIAQWICTRFCCALLCCGYVIVHNDFTWSIIHIHQGYFASTGAIVRLPQCQWSKPDGYGKISQCINTTKHSKAITVCIFLGIYCMRFRYSSNRRILDRISIITFW